MARQPTQSKERLSKAIEASIDNADRLHVETYDLEFHTPCATRCFLLIIAQEEAAKVPALKRPKTIPAPG